MSIISRTKFIAKSMKTLIVETTKAVKDSLVKMYNYLRVTPVDQMAVGFVGLVFTAGFIYLMIWGLIHLVPVFIEIMLFAIMFHLWAIGVWLLLIGIGVAVARHQARQNMVFS